MKTRRRSAAVIVTLSGAAIAAGGALPWVCARGRRPTSGITHTSLTGLFHWSYQTSSPFLRSFGLAVVVAGVLVLIGGLIASRALAALFSLIALAAGGLWIGLNATHYNPVNLPYSDLRVGAWLTIGGGLAGLIGALFLRRAVRT
jgi:hypothetical protein